MQALNIGEVFLHNEHAGTRVITASEFTWILMLIGKTVAHVRVVDAEADVLMLQQMMIPC